MIVVFVIDTSPSMRQPLSEAVGNDRSSKGGGMSRLDLAKMAVEDIVRGLNKRVTEHNVYLQQHPELHQSLRNIGLGFSPNDDFLLLSTGRQHTQHLATAACGAGGRLLVGFGDHSHDQSGDNHTDQPVPHHSNVDSFQKQLKRLRATEWEPGKMGPNKKSISFPEDGGGSTGLNMAVSAGLQTLSRYRLTYRSTENFGMGRLPSPAVLSPNGGPSMYALQPACLVVITDGVCLRSPPVEGGGSLQLQYGKMPLREFYQEPFRWDQRIFCLGVGGKEGETSTQFLHPHLRALCEVTGGSHMMLRSSAKLSQSTGLLLKQIAPPRPRDLPIPDPLKLQAKHTPLVGVSGTFVSGGPVCSFQALEGDLDSGPSSAKHRAMLLYVPQKQAQAQLTSSATVEHQAVYQSPTWCIPESYFPSKKLDVLPPRSAQPNLTFSRFPGRLGSRSFEPSTLLKALHRLDQLVLSNRKNTSPPPQGQGPFSIKLLSRDVYVCEWISTDGKPAQGPVSPMSMDYFPVVVTGAARPSLSEGEGNYLNIGILHVPSGTSTLGSDLASGVRVSTLTLLPPEPHILLPLLIRAAEAEHRALKKVMTVDTKDGIGGANPASNLLKNQILASRNVQLDEHWRNEFRAYLFRVPPYYQNAMKRSLRSVLPASAHSLLNADGVEGALASQCFSKTCLQKLRSAEMAARESNERLERQEVELRRRGKPNFETVTRTEQQQSKRPQGEPVESQKPIGAVIGYGQYDPRSGTDCFLAALRNMPPPWRVATGSVNPKEIVRSSTDSTEMSSHNSKESKVTNTMDALGDLPSDCLMAYYESRRRWIFGGSGVTTRGLFIDGIPNDGSNAQHCGAKRDEMDESLLSLAGVGASQLNATTTAKMGDYRERLLWSRAPVVGYGSNDCTGVSATTSADGGPRWSVDDDAMPVTFFNPRTGEFADSVQARVRSRLMVNFGNPYKDKRADSLIPEQYFSQSPSSRNISGNDDDGGPMTPPGSPPHDAYSAPESEGEGEAVFAKPISRVRKSPTRNDAEDAPFIPDAKRQKKDNELNVPKHAMTPLSSMEIDKTILPPPPPRRAPPPPSNRLEKKQEPPSPDSTKPPPPPKGSMPPGSGVPPPPRPPLKAAAASSGTANKNQQPPPGSKGPSPKAPPGGPPSKLTRRGLTGDRPPAPPSRPNAPPPSAAPSTANPNVSRALPQTQPVTTAAPQAKKPPVPQTQTATIAAPQAKKAPVQQIQPAMAAALQAKKPPVPPTQTATIAAPQVNKPPVPQIQPAMAAAPQAKKPPVPQTQPATTAAPQAKKPSLSQTQPATIATPAEEIDMQSPDKKPVVDLPAGWMTVWSKSQKRWYFFCTKTNKSAWQWPPH